MFTCCRLLAEMAVAAMMWFGGYYEPMHYPAEELCCCSEQDSDKPCCCKEDCKCKDCKCQSCPAKTDFVIRYPAHTCCPGAYHGRMCMPEPAPIVMSHACIPAQAVSSVHAGQYTVAIRLPQGSFGGCGSGLICPPVDVVEGDTRYVALPAAGSNARPGCMHKVGIKARRAGQDMVEVIVEVQHCDLKNHTTHCASCVHTMKLDEVTGVPLNCATWHEPVFAEVTVSKSRPHPALSMPGHAPAAPVQVALPPMNNAMVWTAPVQVPMPAPMPPAMVAPPAQMMGHPMPPMARMPMPVPPPGAMQPMMPILPPPVAMQPMMPLMPPAYAVPPVAPVVKPSTHVTVVKGSGKSRLCLKSSSDVSSKVVRLETDAYGTGPITLAAGKRYVHLKGNMWKASADSVELKGNGVVVLTGHVKLCSDKVGPCAAVRAEQVCVDVHGGKIVKMINVVH